MRWRTNRWCCKKRLRLGCCVMRRWAMDEETVKCRVCGEPYKLYHERLRSEVMKIDQQIELEINWKWICRFGRTVIKTLLCLGKNSFRHRSYIPYSQEIKMGYLPDNMNGLRKTKVFLILLQCLAVIILIASFFCETDRGSAAMAATSALLAFMGFAIAKMVERSLSRRLQALK